MFPALQRQLAFLTNHRFGIGWLFAAASIPGMLVGLVLFYETYQGERAQLEQGALQIARALSLAMEKDLAGIEGKLQILATSPSLHAGDLKTFYRQSQAALGTESLAGAITLIDGTGQQVMNTHRPFGSELPRTGHIEMVQKTFETGRPNVSDLFVGAVVKRPFVALAVPVFSDGKVIHALVMGISAERINHLLAKQNLPAGWVATLLDSRGVVIARSRNADRYTGQTAPSDFLARLNEVDEGTKTGHNLDGASSFVAFSRSRTSGWTVAVVTDREVLHASLYRRLAVAGLAMVTFLLGGMILAKSLSRHLRDALSKLEAATRAGAAGDLEAQAPLVGPREVVQLARQFNGLLQARKTAEERLRHSEEFTNDIINGLPGIFYALDKEGSFVRWNNHFCRVTGCCSAELAGTPMFRFFDDTSAVLFRKCIADALEQGSSAVEVSLLDKDGCLIPYYFTACRTSIGNQLYLVGLGIDIGERKEAEQSLAEERETRQRILEQQVAERTADLQAANRQLAGFLYAASHDLKGPLGRISSFSTLLERNYRDRLEGSGLLFLDFIRDNALRLTKLIDDLLTHARVDQQAARLQSIDIQAAVQAVLKDKEEDIRERGALVRLELPAAHVLADPYGLSQALNNLLENALKYSANISEPAIEIGGAAVKGGFRLWVRDNGIGFDMEYHDKIFEIFRRLHTYTEYAGSGVGLALVKRAMERMGGRVWAESEPGKGAVFYLEVLAALQETEATHISSMIR